MSGEENSMTAAELAEVVGGRVAGDGGARVRDVAGLDAAGEGDVAFVEDAKHVERARASKATCLIVPAGVSVEGRCVIEAARPKLAFALAAAALRPARRRAPGVHASAVVAEGAELGDDVHVGPHAVVSEGATVGARTQILAGAVVSEGARVGADCVLHPNVVLYERVTLGDRVILHAGVHVGADGFGYVRDEAGEYRKFPQIGTVVIEDDVEIGAGSCVDRGALGETRVGRGTKLDNLVQVGHNVSIGERVVIAAQTGISGSTVIESDAVIGGQVGMGDHARVSRGAVVGSKAGILPGKIVRPGAVVWGVPVRPLDEYKRLNAHFGRLPQMRDDLNELKARVAELEARLKEES
ncbi:MAG TPA: UDP-3-O-(3-hydroxymyristoyl)glucosamine N-acyltransferase [Pyrinomonadaceae bacterium]|nr:UDP-3-O-(3-hydroxymyristoyl)glucosamine N-acyltransferase [Pyrinomonadaceae bacterium]